MIEIEKTSYDVLSGLFPDNHPYVEVPMIVRGKRGRAWVDDPDHPKLGMLYLGEMAFIEGEGDIRQLAEPLKQIVMKEGEICCERRFGGVVRESFTVVKESFNVFFKHDGKSRNYSVPTEFNIAKIDRQLFQFLNGTGENWLGAMYVDGVDFEKTCKMGYAILKEGKLISASIPFGYDGRRANIGVGTNPEYRNLGLSKVCTSRLIKDLLARKIEPIWITDPDNIASRTVAERNGFTEDFSLPIFWIKNE